MKEIGPVRPVSLYLHFPFCVRKCRYCDFLSGPASEEERDNYIELLCREIRLRSSEVPGQVDTVFLGGGTPSLMTAAQMHRLMECLSDAFAILPGAEISMEVNPGTADGEKLRSFRESGINRISIGVQSGSRSACSLLTTKNCGFWGGSTRPAKPGRSFVLQGQPDLPISIWT